MPDPLPLAGRIAVVTGATRGIGRAAGLALAAAGAHVVAVGRTQGALEEFDDEIRAWQGERPTLVTLDLTNGDGIDQLGGALYERYGRVDVLVHAAAMLGGLRPVSHTEPKVWERIVSTNLTASYRLIRSFEPLLKAADAGRALFLTSGRAVRPKAYWGAYAATKAGMDALVRCWADEMENTKVRAVLVDPNQMRTKMRAEAYPGEDPDALPDPSEIGPMIVELAQAEDPGLPGEYRRFSDWKAARASAG
ncbi:MAG TPA: SDR family NAD(P)-dependent oxidoreductase [Caulobacteraceae bacterium]|nr:SDR family NAD(P)-dependent oxidoreductase [Caulobacteraceae bacterium]